MYRNILYITCKRSQMINIIYINHKNTIYFSVQIVLMKTSYLCTNELNRTFVYKILRNAQLGTAQFVYLCMSVLVMGRKGGIR